jgi:hypothetical protein
MTTPSFGERSYTIVDWDIWLELGAETHGSLHSTPLEACKRASNLFAVMRFSYLP